MFTENSLYLHCLIFITMKKILILFAFFVMLASCGSPRSSVRVVNKAEGVQTTVSTSVGDGGSTTVTVSPKVTVDSTQIL